MRFSFLCVSIASQATASCSHWRSWHFVHDFLYCRHLHGAGAFPMSRASQQQVDGKELSVSDLLGGAVSA